MRARWCGVVILALVTGSGCAAPRGAPWTIRCMELRGPAGHMEAIAETLRRTPGIRADEVMVRDESDGASRLYYGRYHRTTDRRTGQRVMPQTLRDDLSLLRELVMDGGQRPFLHAIPVRTPQRDVGHPAWDLRRVKAMYTLQVAAFEPTDEFWEFKQAAAEYCAYLRQQGYEAYYHHSDASSVVTVGAFGPEAVVVGADGLTYYSGQVQALQRDELLKHNLLNGGLLRVRADDGSMVAMPSRLVEIPRPDAPLP